MRAQVDLIAHQAAVTYRGFKAGLTLQILKTAVAVGEFIKRRAFTETVYGVDVSTLAFTKALTAAAAAADQALRSLGKTKADQVGTADVVSLVALKSLTDAAAAVDVALLMVTRSRSDSAVASDSATRWISKALSEGVTVTDSLFMIRDSLRELGEFPEAMDEAILSLVKTAADIAVTSDAAAKVVGKPFSDAAGAIDAYVRTITKGLTESVGFNELLVFVQSRGLTDEVEAQETVGKLLTRSFLDTVTATDDIVMGSLVDRDMDDGAASADEHTYSLDRFLADPVGVLDGTAKSFSRALPGEAVTVSDVYSRTIGKAPTEGVNTADAGTGFHQSYAVDYFAADYVGTNFSI